MSAVDFASILSKCTISDDEGVISLDSIRTILKDGTYDSAVEARSSDADAEAVVHLVAHAVSMHVNDETRHEHFYNIVEIIMSSHARHAYSLITVCRETNVMKYRRLVEAVLSFDSFFKDPDIDNLERNVVLLCENAEEFEKKYMLLNFVESSDPTRIFNVMEQHLDIIGIVRRDDTMEFLYDIVRLHEGDMLMKLFSYFSEEVKVHYNGLIRKCIESDDDEVFMEHLLIFAKGSMKIRTKDIDGIRNSIIYKCSSAGAYRVAKMMLNYKFDTWQKWISFDRSHSAEKSMFRAIECNRISFIEHMLDCGHFSRSFCYCDMTAIEYAERLESSPEMMQLLRVNPASVVDRELERSEKRARIQ